MKVTILIQDTPNGKTDLKFMFDPPTAARGQKKTQAEAIGLAILRFLSENAKSIQAQQIITKD